MRFSGNPLTESLVKVTILHPGDQVQKTGGHDKVNASEFLCRFYSQQVGITDGKTVWADSKTLLDLLLQPSEEQVGPQG